MLRFVERLTNVNRGMWMHWKKQREMVKEGICVNWWMQSVKWQDNQTEQIEAPKIRWREDEEQNSSHKISKENNIALDKARLDTEANDLSIPKESLEVRACPETSLSSSFQENPRDVIRSQQPAFVICITTRNLVLTTQIWISWCLVWEWVLFKIRITFPF